ncbi:MAG: hypothetical protein QHH14_07525 [Clostridiales bacterium]|jgi:hypothetical protein|nr:hypothetical protein [Clostridiales bacterium]
MKINGDNLKDIYKSYVLTRTPPMGQACPSSEEISNLFSEPGLKTEKEKIIDHITNCSFCTQEFFVLLQLWRQEKKLAEEIKRLLKNEDEQSPVPKMEKTPRFALAWKFVLASVIVVALAGTILLITSGLIFDTKTEKRGARPEKISLLEPHSNRASETPLVFRWNEIAGRDYFVIEIFDESLSPLWKSAQVFETFYWLPADVEKQMHRGRSYFWMITVFFTNGLTRESHLEEFRIAD